MNKEDFSYRLNLNPIIYLTIQIFLNSLIIPLNSFIPQTTQSKHQSLHHSSIQLKTKLKIYRQGKLVT